MSNDTGIFESLTTEILIRLVIITEAICVLFAAIIYAQFSGLFFIYLPILLVVHLMTILALPSVFKKLKGDSKEELLGDSEETDNAQNDNKVDLWDRTAVGFYVFTNGIILFVLFVRLY